MILAVSNGDGQTRVSASVTLGPGKSLERVCAAEGVLALSPDRERRNLEAE